MRRRTSSHWSRLVAALMLVISIASLSGASSPRALASDTPTPTAITIAGSFQSELGCPGDWQSDCAITHLTYDANDGVWQGSFTIPAGAWLYKAPLNNGWDENYGRGGVRGGDNIPLALAAETPVKFYYDHETHWITDNYNSVIAVAPGDFQSELGCAGDWDPSCLRSWLQDPDGDGVYSFQTTALPAGDYQGKVAINEGWSENYGANGVPGGDNIAFSVPVNGAQVTFNYNSVTKVLTVLTPEPGDVNLIRDPVIDPMQDEVFYFVLPDRFANGSTANDFGGLTGGISDTDVLRHGFKPDDKGYYHGGDLAGLTSKLDYLEGMGVTAIWMAPIFKNKFVQGDGTVAGSSAGYHGYWTIDYTQVDPHFGTNDELKTLIAGAQERDIKVFFDIVTNHTADVIDYLNPGNYNYISKSDRSYFDEGGNRFDDVSYAGGEVFPDLNGYSFPYRPTFRTPADATVKVPAWLNDPTNYHNRGNSTFSGESSTYGDFVGLDDLFTEKPEVVNGMIDIFKYWIGEFGVDGFRVDTAKHVNDEFWQQFVPAIKQYAATQGKPNFFVFGEVFSGDVPFLSRYTTQLPFPAVLDFSFQGTATGFANGGATDSLRDLYYNDDYYTDTDSNAYNLPAFLGNHDIGRVGLSIKNANGDATDEELVARMKLAHALMFFGRGIPVIYYGDEQGFVGDGGDKDARQDMFPSEVVSYNDDDLIGTDKTTADDNFDTTHPLYQAFKAYAQIYKDNPALRRGTQIHRYSSGEAGVYAFSRIDRSDKVEHLVLLNNAEVTKTVTFKTDTKNGTFNALLPTDGAPVYSNAAGEVTIEVAPLSTAIYKAAAALPASTSAPGISLTAPDTNKPLSGNVMIAAQLGEQRFAEVTFAVKVGKETEYRIVGTDTNAPYRVNFDTTGIPDGTPITFKAVVSDLYGNFNSAKQTGTIGVEACQVQRAYAIIHYNRPAGDYQGWGLHLWGDAIDPSEATEWASPKPFVGTTSYGVFAFVKLKDASKPLNFIIHKGDEKDTPNDRSFIPVQTPEVWLKQGSADNYASRAAAQGFVTIRYDRTSDDYGVGSGDYWGLHLWGENLASGVGTNWDAPRPADGVDAYGAFYNIPIADASKPVNFIVHTPSGDSIPATREPGGDRSFVPNKQAEIWLKQGDPLVYNSEGAAKNFAVLHYHRPAGDYGDYTSDNFNDFWGVHLWEGAATPPPSWQQPQKPEGNAPNSYGITFKINLSEGAKRMAYIFHRGDAKDKPADQFLDIEGVGNEVWIVQDMPGDYPYLLPMQGGCQLGVGGDLSKYRAHWISRNTHAWNIPSTGGHVYKLFGNPNGGMTLNGNAINNSAVEIDLIPDPMGMTPALKERFPHLANYSTFKIPADKITMVPELLKGQLAVLARTKTGELIEATGLQIPGVLDDIYVLKGAYSGDVYLSDLPLGVSYDVGVPTIRLWAPTAKSVKLHIFDTSTISTSTVIDMLHEELSGSWMVLGDPSWTGKYYLYEIEVYVHSTGKVERNIVTDPYSLSLSTNSKRSQIVDLSDASLKPAGWDTLAKPALAAPEDIVLYELHVRDFSINDATVPEDLRGTYKAFTVQNSDGMKHLSALARAGLTHIHLLPAFDIATIEEDKSKREEPDPTVLGSFGPDSDQQQATIQPLRDKDGFNWGYDPYHYTTPEGSYSTNPDGTTRVVEFREMVQSLSNAGLRTVMDVVYNHTNSAGQNEKSVLDRIVPGYYHRLDLNGAVTTSTCCQNTATEHAMMERLMLDSIVTWARAYKVDGFRFDLMGHHMKDDMIKVREALDALTLLNDGVDGKNIYVYGEGWNFGEVADGARGINATQRNMAGTGIGTFNDRLRDAVRGGGPFDTGNDMKKQGFASGLFSDPNDFGQGSADEQRARLLHQMDQIRVGMAGNLKDFSFVDRNGNVVRGDEVDYNGSPTGYTEDPQEVITYVEAHDNETLFDALQIKAPATATITDRVRMQNLAISTVMLGQGIPFFQAGQDLLRSKSMDRNSYNSGDWFNKLDWSYNSNNWGVGLPPADANASSWDVMRPLLANPDLKPQREQIVDAAAHFREMLRIRKSSPLFRLRTAEEIKNQLTYLNTGADQIPGLIVSVLSDNGPTDLDPKLNTIVTLMNANDTTQTFTATSLISKQLSLHPVQFVSSDPLVREASFDPTTGTFSIPPRTTVVFTDQATTPGAVTTIEPGKPATLSFAGPNGKSFGIEIPAGAVSETVNLRFQTITETLPISANQGFIGFSFDLNAFDLGSELLNDFRFNKPITITFTYTDTELAGLNENEVKLYFLDDTGKWVDAATSCVPVSTYQRDLVNNRVSVGICHLSRFAGIADALNRLFLPVVIR